MRGSPNEHEPSGAPRICESCSNDCEASQYSRSSPAVRVRTDSVCGTENALYDRHLVFDRAIDPKVASARERFEAFSRSVRDILAQRWVKTKTTYEQQNAKRIYYLSMEFLLGRSLANNITNLLLEPVAQLAIKEKGIDWLEMIEQEPDAGLGNGGLGRLAACFLDSMATIELPATGYGLRYEYGMFRQSFE